MTIYFPTKKCWPKHSPIRFAMMAMVVYGIKMETRLKWKCMGHKVKKTMSSDTDTYALTPLDFFYYCARKTWTLFNLHLFFFAYYFLSILGVNLYVNIFLWSDHYYPKLNSFSTVLLYLHIYSDTLLYSFMLLAIGYLHVKSQQGNDSIEYHHHLQMEKKYNGNDIACCIWRNRSCTSVSGKPVLQSPSTFHNIP